MGEVISPRRVKSLTGKTEAVIAEECRKELRLGRLGESSRQKSEHWGWTHSVGSTVQSGESKRKVHHRLEVLAVGRWSLSGAECVCGAG